MRAGHLRDVRGIGFVAVLHWLGVLADAFLPNRGWCASPAGGWRSGPAWSGSSPRSEAAGIALESCCCSCSADPIRRGRGAGTVAQAVGTIGQLLPPGAGATLLRSVTCSSTVPARWRHCGHCWPGSAAGSRCWRSAVTARSACRRPAPRPR